MYMNKLTNINTRCIASVPKSRKNERKGAGKNLAIGIVSYAITHVRSKRNN